MKVLLSCFACAPNRGSEPGVGWNWAVNLAKYHDVVVLTRTENRKKIDDYRADHNLDFEVEYFGIEFFEKNLNLPFRENLYSLLWQKRVVGYAEKLQKQHNFNVCHHVTYATFKFPSRLYKLNIPLVIGPVGGGEVTPKSCYSKYSLKGRFKEIAHDMQISIMKRSRSVQKMCAAASKILVATNETFYCVPETFRGKCKIMQTIAVDENEIAAICLPSYQFGEKFTVLYVGMLKEWKGLGLLIDVAASLNESYPNQYEFVLIGDGPDKSSLSRWIAEKNLEEQFKFLGNVEREAVLENMKRAHVFLYPSFHDSGAMVVLEAMSQGLPVVALGAGGPAVNIKDGSGYLIDANQTYEDIVNDFVEAVVCIHDAYINNRDQLVSMINHAAEMIKNECTWQAKAKLMNGIYEEIVRYE